MWLEKWSFPQQRLVSRYIDFERIYNGVGFVRTLTCPPNICTKIRYDFGPQESEAAPRQALLATIPPPLHYLLDKLVII